LEIEHYLSPTGRDLFQDWLDGLRDLRSGHRVYFARPANDRALLLGGGSKRRQAADIAAAVGRWNAYKERK